MPRCVRFIRAMHHESYRSWRVALAEDDRNLAVSHYPTLWYLTNQLQNTVFELVINPFHNVNLGFAGLGIVG